MPFIRIERLDDPRLDIYRNLRQKNLIRQSGCFIAEGRRVVERLLESPYEVQSLLLSEKRVDALAGRLDEKIDLFVLAQQEASRLIGFRFHNGVLACAKRLENPSLESMIQHSSDRSPILVCCPKITDPDNLGSLIRLGAGFGVQGIVLGTGSVDPYIRRVIRVSMGTFFNVPIRMDNNLFNELKSLREQNRCRIVAAEKTDQSQALGNFSGFEKTETVKTETEKTGTVTIESEKKETEKMTGLDSVLETDPEAQDRLTVLLLGNEAEGLDSKWLEMADRILHVPMQQGVDSLNITHAAAIFLYEMTRNRQGLNCT